MASEHEDRHDYERALREAEVRADPLAQAAARIAESYVRHDMGCDIAIQSRFAKCDCDLAGRTQRATNEILAALQQAQAPAEIDCPLCGETVKQVASATLGLALWQHVNWTCSKRQAQAPASHLVGKGGVIEEMTCVACGQTYPDYTSSSTMRCHSCRAQASDIHEIVVRDLPGRPVAAPCAISGCQYGEQAHAPAWQPIREALVKFSETYRRTTDPAEAANAGAELADAVDRALAAAPPVAGTPEPNGEIHTCPICGPECC